MKGVAKRIIKKGGGNRFQVHKSLPIDSIFSKKNYKELIKDLFYFVDPTKDKKTAHYKNITVEPIKDKIGYKVPTSIPKSVIDLMVMVKNKFNIPKSCKVEFKFCYAMRLSKSILEPPSCKTAARFLINYNNHDVAHFTKSLYKVNRELIDVGEISKGIHMKKDHIALLGPCDMCHYNITTKPGKMIYMTDMKGTKKTTIKPNNYARLTIIIDIQINVEYGKQLIEDTKKMKNNKISNLTKKIIHNMVKILLRKVKDDYINVLDQVEGL